MGYGFDDLDIRLDFGLGAAGTHDDLGVILGYEVQSSSGWKGTEPNRPCVGHDSTAQMGRRCRLHSLHQRRNSGGISVEPNADGMIGVHAMCDRQLVEPLPHAHASIF